VSSTFNQAQIDLNGRFKYTSDGKLDSWQILKSEGILKGDCEDYSLTLIWLSEGKSTMRFWLALLTFKYLIWYCKSPSGVGHACLWVRGRGWTDNIQRKVLKDYKAMNGKGYKLVFPYVVPIVLLKMLIGKVLRAF